MHVFNGLQGACLKGCSSLSTTLLLRETIAHNLDRGSSVYVCLLDARKAFDSVWYPGLFFKLNLLGCNINLWRVLWDYYQGFECCVFVAGGHTNWFQIQQGVHQGAPFSMRLYVAYNNDLLDELQSSDLGAGISSPRVNLCCPAYADDIAIVAIHKRSMQSMLNITATHSSRWRYDFNPQKSHVLIFGPDIDPGRDPGA